jgi:hypothetical protein
VVTITKSKQKVITSARQQKQLRALRAWMRSVDGTKTLGEWCAEFGVDTNGLYKLITDRGIMEKAMKRAELETELVAVTCMRRLLEAVHDEDTSVATVLKISEHVEKKRAGAYRPRKGDGKPNVAIQINLPPGLEQPDVRKKVLKNAEKELGEDLL